jgi:hypothetical protein
LVPELPPGLFPLSSSLEDAAASGEPALFELGLQPCPRLTPTTTTRQHVATPLRFFIGCPSPIID